MALRCNGYRFGDSVFRHVGGALVSIYGATSAPRNMGQLPGRMRGLAWLTDDMAGLPLGNLAPTSWMLPQKPGAMSSRNAAVMDIDGAGLCVGGITTTAPASFSITVADMVGQLKASAIGSATFALTSGAAELFGVLTGAGSASFAVSAASATLGAEASITADGAFSFGAVAGLLPADDTPPARTAAATFSVGGTLTPYAIGKMVGSTDVASELTAASIAAEVLAAAASSPIAANIERVRGQALGGTGTSGDPWGPA